MEQKVLGYIKKHNIFENGDNVIAAVSGGADSVMMLHFLFANKNALGINLFCAHFEHGLRGAESARDAMFVQELCENYGVQCFVEYGGMAENNITTAVEETARNLRYAFLNTLAEKLGAKIATAHNQNDNVETMLFNAIRGTGPKGLAGIPVKNGIIVRPVLQLSRAEIEKYCEDNELEYMQDSTNDENIYSRNLLRNDIIPKFETVHPGAQNALAHLAEDMRGLSSWLDEEAEKLLIAAREKASKQQWRFYDFKDTVAYDAEVLKNAPQPLRLYALAQISGLKTNRDALERMQSVLFETTPVVEVPGGKRIYIYKGCFFAESTFSTAKKTKSSTKEIPLQQGNTLLWGKYAVEATILNKNDKNEKYLQKPLTFFADYDKLLNCSVFRTRKHGDTFTPQGRGVTKTLKKWMNEEGIPAFIRDNVPVLANGDTIFWVWGHGFCEKLRPKNETKQILQLKMLWNGDYI